MIVPPLLPVFVYIEGLIPLLFLGGVALKALINGGVIFFSQCGCMVIFSQWRKAHQ